MFQLPLAAADFWGFVVSILFIAVLVISHLWNAIQGGQQKRVNQQPRRPGDPQRDRPLGPAQGQPAGQSKLNAEIEQFLKRANERREKKNRRLGKRNEAQPTAAETQQVESLDERDFDSVASSVQQHLGSRTFEQREQHLADDIEHADEEMEQHLQQVFTHRLGSLENSSALEGDIGTPEVKPPASAADRAAAARAVAGLLVNQQNIRQAVLLKEILERPVDRW